ncbi:MAG: amidohydrolase [Candidatus Bipolaricaulota bacterium]|nr:amidohydrolase [Candidatus Bipolaricaulota bacterium]
MATSSRRDATDLDRVIDESVRSMDADLVRDRREIHRHAESAWTEFWTTSFVARRLAELGYETQVGHRVCADDARVGVPPSDVLEGHLRRAESQGADPRLLDAMRGGFTGSIGIRSRGRSPVIALRVDIDALDLIESSDVSHRPAREGFASVNRGAAHACGHDGHAAIGLGVARVIAQLPVALEGTLRLIFQPAEEGVRGARSIVAAGHLADVDYVIGCHLLTGWAVGELASGLGGYAATRKFDVHFVGEAAHAGGQPEGGKNALLAAATAALHLHALPRHHGGFTRVHVGRMEAGTGRNVIPDRALLVAEVRGGTSALCHSMYERAMRVIEGAAAMYDCEVEILPMGQADTAQSDPTLAQRLERVSGHPGEFAFHHVEAVGGSEDFTEMMRAVQSRGGLATSLGIGADAHGTRRDAVDRSRVLAAHSATFDFDERALGVAVRVLSRLVVDLATERRGGA